MTRVARAISILLLVAGAAGCAHGWGWRKGPAMSAEDAAAAQWAALRTLEPGASLRVRLFTREVVSGVFGGADEQRIVLSSSATVNEFLRPDVQHITLLTGPTRGRRARIGFLTGAAAGALVAATTTDSSTGAWVLMMSAGWGALGALFGSLDGPEKTVIYQAPPAPRSSQAMRSDRGARSSR